MAHEEFDGLASQAEDVAARGSGPRYLESLHGGTRSLPDYGQTRARDLTENDIETKEDE